MKSDKNKDSIEKAEFVIHNKRSKILIVDDSEINRIILNEILKEKYDIIEADSGERAIEVMKSLGKELKVVLLDIVMPDVDGFGVLDFMNQNGYIDKMAVLMISTESDSDVITHAYNMGVVDFLSRPFDNRLVQQIVENTIHALESNTIKKHRVIPVSDSGKSEESKNKKNVVSKENIREYAVEFIFSMIFVLCGIIIYVLTGNALNGLSYALFVMVSGYYANPVFTIADSIKNKRNVIQCLFKILSQFVGGVFGAVISCLVFSFNDSETMNFQLEICREMSIPAVFTAEFCSVFGIVVFMLSIINSINKSDREMHTVRAFIFAVFPAVSSYFTYSALNPVQALGYSLFSLIMSGSEIRTELPVIILAGLTGAMAGAGIYKSYDSHPEY